uniref:Uncharacterized protein n=1 Tax=Tetradesmus obliquus TaxID=3088 RepID=A0A383W2B8_TETOB|eukprot:jgi/Sobl393_1/19463/SZX71262.1
MRFDSFCRGVWASLSPGVWGCKMPLDGSPAARVRPSDLDLLLGTWLARTAATTASAGPAGQLLQLQAAFSRSPAVSELHSEAPRRLVLLLGLRLAARAAVGIEDDEEDLFYETGRTTQALLQALAAPGPPRALSPPFLAAMLCSCTSQGSAAAWGRVLGSVLKGFGAYKFTGGVTELEQHMVALDRVTGDQVLLRQLAHMLCQELLTLPQGPLPPAAASAAAQAHAKRSVLAPLLCMAAAVDPLAVLRAGSGFFESLGGGSGGGGGGYAPSGAAKVSAAAAGMSPATGLFTCLRSYPSNAGEADGARRILTALLGRVGEAMHQVAKRLAGLKVRMM